MIRGRAIETNPTAGLITATGEFNSDVAWKPANKCVAGYIMGAYDPDIKG